MKKKSILLLILILMFSLVAFACNGCGNEEKPTPEPEPGETVTIKKISDVLKDGKNNDELVVEGVVYGILKNGFYVADSAEGKIFVVMGDNWTASCKIGDKVQITGKFGYVSNFPQIKNVTEVKVLSSDNESFVKATDGTVADILRLDSKARTGVYGNMYTITGTIYKNNANILTLTDDDNNTCYFFSQSNLTILEEYIGKRVIINVVVHNYSETWNVSFAGGASDIVKNELSFDAIKEEALAHINEAVPKEIYGRLTLPSNHPTLQYVTYTWSVEANDYIAIADNKATVTVDEADHEVTLKVTISNGEQSETVEYKITSKAIEERSVKDLFNGELAINYSTVKVRGIVIGKSRNQSLSIRSLIVKDMNTNDITTFDFGPSNSNPNVILHSDDLFKNTAVGDEILVMGELRNGADDRTCVTNITSLTVVDHDNEWAHDFENAYVLNTKESYDELGQNVKKYENKLVKFDNPYLCYSTSSTPADTNWLILSHSSDVGTRKYGNEGKQRSFAFLLACVDENLGGTTWRDSFEYPYVNQEGAQFDLTIYAYAMYVSDSYLAFIVPDQSCFIASSKMQVELALSKDVPTSVEGGTLTLAKTHELVDGEITWASDNAAIDATTGEVKEVAVSTTVTLTATYKIGSETYTSTFKVEVLAATPMSVSEVLALTEDKKVKVQGIIVAYVSDGNTQAQRMGVLLMDPTTKDLVMVDGLSNLSGEYGAYKDSEGTLLKVGDMIIVNATYHLDSAQIGTSGPAQTGRHHVEVTSNDMVVRTAENQEIVYGDPALTIDSNDKMADLSTNIKDYFGKLIKIVGTKEAPIYIGGSSNNAPFNIKVFMTNATNNDGTKYGNYTFVLKSDVNAPNGGADNWYTTLFGIEGPFVCPNNSNPAIAWVGTLYVVVGYNTSSYFQMSIVNYENCSGSQFLSPEMIGEHLLIGLPEKVKAGDWTVNLPTSNEQVDGEITWASGNELIDLTNNKVGYADEDTEVTITGSYKVENVDYTVEYKVTVEKSPSKAEVESALKEGIPETVQPGPLSFTLVTTAEGASDVSWASSNAELIDLTNNVVANVGENTEVTLTASYKFRGADATLEVKVTILAVASLEDVQAALIANIPDLLVAGDLPMTLLTSHPKVTGDVTWAVDKENVNLETNKVTITKEEASVTVTFTATFTFNSETKTATKQATILFTYSVSEALALTENTENIYVRGIVSAYIGDGNSTASRLGIMLKDTATNDNLLVGGLSNIGGEFGSYVYSNDDDMTIGDEIVLGGTFLLSTPKKYGDSASTAVSSIEIANRKMLWVTADNDAYKLSSDNEVTYTADITITNNTELVALSQSLSSYYGKVIKIVGTAENPIQLGGSGSSAPFNIKVFMNNAATNDETKYEGKIFALKSDINAENLGDTWANDLFGISKPFVGPKDPQTAINYSGEIYVVVTFVTGSYYQMVLVNYSSCNATCLSGNTPS